MFIKYNFSIYNIKYMNNSKNFNILSFMFDQLGASISEQSVLVFKSILKQIGEDLLKNVDILNKLDQEIGDGDNGSTISRFASGKYLYFI